MIKAYIALGSNLDNPGAQLQRAVSDIDSTPDIQVSGCSKLYQSVALAGENVPEDQPDYCNAVVEIETALKPIALLNAMQAIENKHGRVRSVRWEPRTLDLDILLYGDQVIETERLAVPHYQMHLRNFVLFPLADIVPELSLPDGSSLKELTTQSDFSGLQIMDDHYPWF